jgi:sugar lactone lactonase YvrE
LWVCALAARQTLPAPQRHAFLKAFDLKTGRARASYQMPGDLSLCNDIAIAPDGTVFASDTSNGRIVKLDRNGALSVWLADRQLEGVDGLTFVGSSLYVNNIRTGHIFRIPVAAHRAAGNRESGRLIDIALSRPLDQPDGLRALGRRLFVTENRGGKVDEVKIDGDKGDVVTIREGFATPTAVQPVGHVLWVAEGKFRYRNDPALQGSDPGVFTIYALPLPN